MFRSQYPFGTKDSPYDHGANCSSNACDSNGWPLASSYGIWVWEMESAENAGIYKVTANGNAVVTTWQFGPVINTHYDPATNVWTGEINATDAKAGSVLDLRIENASAGGFVNVSVRNPHCDATAIHHPNYIALLKIFNGPLRTMTAVGATDSGQTDWDTRHLVTAPTWNVNPAIPCTTTDDGKQLDCDGNMPWEVLIDAANSAGRDIWVNVPPNATNDYLQGLAELLKAELDPGLNIYVEYASEWGV